MLPPHLSQSVVAGNLVFTSGQLAFENGIIEGDVGAQTHRALANVASVLATHGLGLGDVVKTTIWLTSQADFQSFNDAYAAVFKELQPARSTVICGLALPNALVEIEAVAIRSTP